MRLTEFALQVREHAVGVGRGNRNSHPENDPRQELLGLRPHECRNDRSVEGCDVEGKDGSEDEEEGVQEEERCFFAVN